MTASVTGTRDRARHVLRGVRIHPLWIAPPWVSALAPESGLDPDQWVERSAAAGISGLLLVTKQCEGRCIWPTKQDALRTDEDFLGGVCDAALRTGTRVIAYYCVAIDDYQASLHPDWRFRDRDGVGCRDIGYDWVCLNSPYRDLMFEQLEELLAGYPVDGLWLDIFNLSPRGRDCCCEWCRKSYQHEVGGEIVGALGSQAFLEWRARCLERILDRVVALRDQYRGQATISFNGAGAGWRKHPYMGPESLPLLRSVDYLTDEGHDSRYESAISKVLTMSGRPYEVLTSNGLANEWVGWVTKAPALLCLELATVGSHGGRFGIGVSVLPDGEMPEDELTLLSQVAQFEEVHADLFGPQTAISDAHMIIEPFVPDGEFIPPERPEPDERLLRGGHHHVPELPDDALPCNGLFDALREGHVPFSFIASTSRLDDAPLLVVPSSARLDNEACESIRSYVRSGGSLLAEGHAGLLDATGSRRSNFAIADVLGVNFRGYAGAWDGNYIQVDDDLRSDLPNYPLHVTGPALAVELAGAQELAGLVPPLGGEQSATHHTASLYNPPTRATQGPAITRNRYGRGLAVYSATGLGDHIRRRRNVDPWTKQLVVNMVHMLVPAMLVHTDAPPGVELVINRLNPDQVVIHLLNHYIAAEQVGVRPGPQIAPIRLRLNPVRLGRVRSARIEPSAVQLALSVDEHGNIECVVPSFAIHQALVLECSGSSGIRTQE